MPLALFDLDNTLVNRTGAVHSVVTRLCAAHGVHPADVPRIAEALRERAYPATFAALRRELHLPSPAIALWDWYVDAIAAAVTCPPAVATGLAQLREAGWTVGIVTNGATDIQRAKLRATGLDQVVDAICISDDIGARKPEAQIFHAAAERCGTPLTNGWMVGDNPATDIAGAHAVGLRTIWIAAGRAWTHDSRPADHDVADAAGAVTHLLNL
ncbi:HAD family hydrolase [Streptacidiphilus anmyonensis]|uniref:HAD family hydrolase n=1 Tax=Streptacidiphilus anmyonensis TaxID=405782 RepID=UPI0005A8AFCD|nr:HAD-IIIA family hydrolase [Streptacidiphilus anmyonensis]